MSFSFTPAQMGNQALIEIGNPGVSVKPSRAEFMHAMEFLYEHLEQGELITVKLV